MNATKSFITLHRNGSVKKGLRNILLLAFFVFSHFCARAQTLLPNWVGDLGGATGSATATGLVADKQNNVYITGYFSGTVDFDPSAGIKNLTSAGGANIFVAKYSPAGTLIWAEFMAGNGSDQPNGIAVDKDGNVSITGHYYSTILDADPGAGVFNLTGTGGTNLFTIRLGANGNFLWAHSFQGSSGLSEPGQLEDSFGVGADSQDDVIATYVFAFPFTIGSLTYQPGEGYSSVIVKYGPAGNVLWSLPLYSSQDGLLGVYGTSVDSQDNIVISGTFDASANVNPLGTAYNLTANTLYPFFVAKYAPSGTLIWANAINSPSTNIYVNSTVNTDAQNNVYFSTAFDSSVIFNSAVTVNAKPGSNNICLAKYSSAGVLQYAKSIAATGGISYTNQLATDKSNDLYLTGYFGGTFNVNPGPGNAANLSAHGPQDFYIAKYDPNGNYLYAFNTGSAGCAGTTGNGIAIDANNNVDVAGSFCSTVNFGPGSCSTYNVTAVSSGYDGFIAQYSTGVIANNVITATANSVCAGGTPAAITGSLPTGGSAYTYQWQSSADSVTFVNITGATAQNYSPPALAATTYFERTVSSGGCTSPIISNIVKLIITPAPAAPVLAGASACAGSAVTLSVTSPGQAATFNWYASATGDTILYTGAGFTTPLLTATTTYYVIAVNSTGCSSATRTAVTVTVSPSAVITNNIITAPAVSSFCARGTPTTITGSLPAGGSSTFTYQWQSSADSVNFVNINSATGQNYTPALLTTTTYFRRTASAGTCTTPVVSNDVPITITPPPAAPVVAGSVICAGSTAVLSITSPQQGITYTWYDSATSASLLFTGSSFTTPALSATTIYYAEADNTTGCSSATRTAVTVTVLQPLDAPVVTVDSTTVSGITFTWTAVTGATGYQVSTDGGQTYTAPTSGDTGLTTTVSGLQPNESVTLTVEATGGQACGPGNASAAVTGTTKSPTTDIIYVPNAFTPNGDGRNDQVHVHGESIQSFKLFIYDQWGELLFTSTDIQNGWNGTYRGSKEPAGVYVYYLQAMMIDGKSINKKGTIALLR